MKKRTAHLLIAALATEVLGYGYIRLVTQSGIPVTRTDAASIQYMVHTSMKPGEVNADGAVVITPNSDPMGALSAAAATWTAVPSATVNFLPLKTATSSGTTKDHIYTVTIEDTPEHRSIVGSFLAYTVTTYTLADGQVVDADVFFNPAIVENGKVTPFSTDRSSPSYDIQTLMTHELGHALGAAHSGVIGATMYPYTTAFGPFVTPAESTTYSTLSADDIAFLTTVYPSPDASSKFGKITGTVKFSNGSGVNGALVTAVDAAQGIVIGGFVAGSDGAYAITMMPPGNYQVFAHPLDGPVTTGNYGTNQFGGLTPVTTFQATFSGGNAAPSTIGVSAAGSSQANIVVTTAASGLHIDHLGIGGVAGNDYAYADVKNLIGGTSMMIYLWGKGLNSSITESNIRILGPAVTLRAGTLKTAPAFPVNGQIPLRFIVDVSGSGLRAPVPVAVVTSADATINAGSLVLLPGGGPPAALNTGVLNAASFMDGAVSPGEIVTVYGTSFGPSGSMVVTAAIDPSGKLATSLANTRVLFDGRAAPLVYVANSVASAVVPWEVASHKSTAMTVEYNGVASLPVNLAVSATGPAIFTACSCGSGQVAALNPDNSYNNASAPAAIGSTLTMFWSGGGLLNPQAGTGEVTSGLAYPTVTPTVTIGGAPAVVAYGGAAPNFVSGFLQLNVTIPSGITPGASVPVVITSGSESSRTGVSVAVK